MSDRSTCTYNGCQSPAVVSLTAAFRPTLARDEWATYPMPQAYLCPNHIVAHMELDQAAPGATPAYLIRSIT